MTDEPTYTPGIDKIERDTMRLIVAAAEATGQIVDAGLL